ncbi:unnamed protein product [Prorocentrum cordatum]|uniref:Uncharacterized protein n=1 Tax=Prorocentrum cordatum TaxID=2364126 RepID=A0ABN9VMI3_9DINO|nr:unnamed protein product [Polarella glacialis]
MLAPHGGRRGWPEPGRFSSATGTHEEAASGTARRSPRGKRRPAWVAARLDGQPWDAHALVAGHAGLTRGEEMPVDTASRESGRGPSLVGAARAAEPRGDPPAALAQGAEVPGRSFMPCFLETTTFSGAPSTILPSSSSLHFWPRGWPGPPLRPSGSSRGRQATPIENIFPSVMHRVFGRPK